jgi:apolipoprotein N-acyltransferase
MKFANLKQFLPAPLNILLAVFSAILLVSAFPDFELWFVAWFALVPLFFAVEREKESWVKSFLVGWTFGTCFFFGSCWWLTFAPITYAGFPVILAYFLMLLASLAVGIFPAIFAALFSILLKRFGTYAILSAPFLWTAIEFLRFWTTGNNWNAIAYSHAFQPIAISLATFGGIYLTGFFILLMNSTFCFQYTESRKQIKKSLPKLALTTFLFGISLFSSAVVSYFGKNNPQKFSTANVIAVQPNVPMGGMTAEKYEQLLQKHIELAENALQKLKSQNPNPQTPITVIFPESPMSFIYSEDLEFQQFIRAFALRNNVSVLFNAAEPDVESKKYFNSAVLVDASGRKIAQYDKIYLVPFGEAVPAPFQGLIPALVGSFAYGKEYDLLPFGEAKAGIMICFESHFSNLSREFVKNGADVLIEMTNDGYLGKTPVLRQHLASAVFRTVETNRPLLRVTNVGITAYINERGEISQISESYTEDTRVWTIAKSDGKQTFYVKYGDWCAWLCSFVSLALLFLSFWKRNKVSVTQA